MPGALAVQAVDMTKRFPGVVANDHVSFEAAEGRFTRCSARTGGKTTLCNLLMGLYRPTREAVISGRAVRFHSPRTHRIRDLHGPPAPSPGDSMTVGRTSCSGGPSPAAAFFPRKVEKAVAEAAERFQMPVDPKARIWQLSLGERQRVEILKALYAAQRSNSRRANDRTHAAGGRAAVLQCARHGR